MSEIKVTPSLQSQREVDSMLRNVTRDTTKVREFIAREKNSLYRTELTKLFTATLSFAEKFDGCDSKAMSTLDFKKSALEVFQMVADQRRGGRKLMFVMLSSPTSGLDQNFCSWWPTVRGLDSSSTRLMECFLRKLSREIAAESDNNSSAPPPTLSEKDTEVMVRNKLESDVLKTVREKVNQNADWSAAMQGYSIVTTGDENEFSMTITLIKSKDDSGVGDNDESIKEELPVPVFAHVVPKSESSRQSAARPCDTDGFWVDTSDDEEQFVQISKMTPKGCFHCKKFNFIFRNFSITMVYSFFSSNPFSERK